MATNVRVIHPLDFLRANADGRVDLDAAKTLLQEVATAAASLQDFEVLIDIRDVTTGHLAPDEIEELAGSLARFQDTFMHKTAVLCPRERFDNARIFSTLANRQGFERIRIFLSYEDAMEWLMAKQPT